MRLGPSCYRADMGRAGAHGTHETHIGPAGTPGPEPSSSMGPGPGQYESHGLFGPEPNPCRLGNMIRSGA